MTLNSETMSRKSKPDPNAKVALSEEKLEVTRRRIFEALVDLIGQEGIADISVQSVADRAGVSHRTVYRHFPDKAALLEGLADWIPTELLTRFPRFAPDVDPGPIEGMIPAAWDLFDAMGSHQEAYVRLISGGGAKVKARDRRTERIRRVVAKLTGHLDAHDAEAVVAVFRILGGAGTWASVRRDHDLPPDRARDAFTWVTNLLIRELRKGRGPSHARKETK